MTTTTPALRLSVRGLTGHLLIAAGAAAMLGDVPSKSGQSILGLALVAAGTVLVVTVLRRQALRRRAA